MKEHIVKSGDKYCLRSKKTDKNLGCYPSKSGAENREKQVQYFKHLGESQIDEASTTLVGIDIATGGVKGKNGQTQTQLNNTSEYDYDSENHDAKTMTEMSGMAGGGVEGGVFGKKMKGPWDNDKFDETIFINRESFLEELLLRENIQNTIKETYDKHLNKLQEEVSLRELIQQYIKESFNEAKSKVPDAVHASTGINVLEDLLKKIIPGLEQDYKSLTTNEEQRESFRAHILNAVQKTLSTADINQQATGQIELKETKVKPVVKTNEVDVAVGGNIPDAGKFIDINKPNVGDEEDTFGIAGKDKTGRNMAQASFEKMEKQILDAYGLLDDQEDKVLFADYLSTNLKMYFDKFDSELETDVGEPSQGNDLEQNNI